MAVNITMIRIYANLVQAGRRTIESLPLEYQKPVEDYIKANV